MKITIDKTVKEEIELPEYFQWLNSFYKCLSHGKILAVRPNDFDPELGLEPSIQLMSANFYALEKVNPITKERFDLEYLRTEKILYQLKNR